MLRSTSAIAIAVALIAGCKKKPIPILDPEASGSDFGRGALFSAIAEFRAEPTSPAAYRRLADDIDALRPQFDEQTEELADRMLSFLAIGPLEAHANRSDEERIEALAATVWPTALGPEPKPDESGRAYLERVCADELAGECKFVVPEMWALQLGARVWRRFRQRAQEAYAYCKVCQEDETYRRTLARYDETGFDIETEAVKRKGDGHPSQWPRVDAMAQPWEEILTLEIGDGGELRLSGEKVPAKRWREVLSRRHQHSSAVGLHLRPSTSVRMLRDFARDLGRQGYDEIRLQVRNPEYPYELGYYRIAAPPAPRGALDVELRDSDTVQVAALAMEHRLRQAGRGDRLLDIF